MLTAIIPMIVLGTIILKISNQAITKSQTQIAQSVTEKTIEQSNILITSTINTLKAISAQSDVQVLLEDVHQDQKIDEIIRLNNVLLTLKNTVSSSDKLYETVKIINERGTIIADGSSLLNHR